MINLDDPAFVGATQNGRVVLASIDAFPKQCAQAWNEASSLKFSDKYKKASNIVVCGMGGSRFAPLIVKELFKENIKVPFFINDNYTLPGFVGPETLVMLSSYSGTTEEVLACGESALKRKALISGLCLGGELSEFFHKHIFPAYIFKAIHNPSNQPRIGVGYMVAGHMGLLRALGFLQINKKEIESALTKLPELLADFTLNTNTENNPAKKLAIKLYEKYPYYVVAEHLQGVGNAIANQTNETAKSISSFRLIPELNHHLMEGLRFPKQLKNMGVFVFFPSTFYDKRVQLRFQITKEVVEKNGLETYEYQSKVKTRIEEAFTLIGFGSYMTMYLTALYQQDPSLIPWVDYFKNQLKRKTVKK